MSLGPRFQCYMWTTHHGCESSWNFRNSGIPEIENALNSPILSLLCSFRHESPDFLKSWNFTSEVRMYIVSQKNISKLILSRYLDPCKVRSLASGREFYRIIQYRYRDYHLYLVYQPYLFFSVTVEGAVKGLFQ